MRGQATRASPQLEDFAELAEGLAKSAQLVAFWQLLQPGVASGAKLSMPFSYGLQVRLFALESLLAPPLYGASLISDARCKLAMRYDDAALTLLERLRAARYFKDAEQREYLGTAPSFQRLREKDRFKQLLN